MKRVEYKSVVLSKKKHITNIPLKETEKKIKER